MVPDRDLSAVSRSVVSRSTGPRSAAARPDSRRPRTVALVGIDGSGKTTQAHALAAALARRGLPARYRRNAGGRRWFGRVAAVLGRRDGEHLLGRRTMLFVESVLRWLAILRTLLRRAVTREVAVMDRYGVCQYASIRARAATPRPGRINRAERRARLAYGLFPKPEVTFLLLVDPAVAYERIERRGYDHEDLSYLQAASAAYQAMPEYRDFVVIDANRPPDEVSRALLEHLSAGTPAELPRPRRAAGMLISHARALILGLATLAAAASVLTYQLAEGF
jgi:dTMP kinase